MLNTKIVPGSPSRFLLFCLLGIFGMLFLTNPAIAQDTIDQNTKEESIKKWRVGVYFSGKSFLKGLNEAFSIRSIESSEDDILPYPGLFLTMRYNNYQVLIGWERDGKYEHKHSPIYLGSKHNEHIFRFSARYNYYPFQKIIYLYGGPIIWYFNKEFTFQVNGCSEYLYQTYSSGECVPGKEFIYYFPTNRPDGKSTWFGMQAGLGLEYNIFGLVLSHEIEFFHSFCDYDDFICSGRDLKFLGIHFPF